MRAVLLLTILGVLPAAAAAQSEVEIVTTFHGYPWGTRVENIAEVAGTAQVGEKDGLRIWSAQVTVMGRHGLAGFYFHPESGELVEGAYVFALTLGDCDWAWTTVTRTLQEAYPTLERSEQVPARSGADRELYASDCEFFVFNAHRETWTAEFRNPGPPGDRLELRMRSIERVPRLTVVYRGRAGQAWLERTGR